jgi:hypothetical protein
MSHIIRYINQNNTPSLVYDSQFYLIEHFDVFNNNLMFTTDFDGDFNFDLVRIDTVTDIPHLVVNGAIDGVSMVQTTNHMVNYNPNKNNNNHYYFFDYNGVQKRMDSNFSNITNVDSNGLHRVCVASLGSRLVCETDTDTYLVDHDLSSNRVLIQGQGESLGGYLTINNKLTLSGDGTKMMFARPDNAQPVYYDIFTLSSSGEVVLVKNNAFIDTAVLWPLGNGSKLPEIQGFKIFQGIQGFIIRPDGSITDEASGFIGISLDALSGIY